MSLPRLDYNIFDILSFLYPIFSNSIQHFQAISIKFDIFSDVWKVWKKLVKCGGDTTAVFFFLNSV